MLLKIIETGCDDVIQTQIFYKREDQVEQVIEVVPSNETFYILKTLHPGCYHVRIQLQNNEHLTKSVATDDCVIIKSKTILFHCVFDK